MKNLKQDLFSLHSAKIESECMGEQKEQVLLDNQVRCSEMLQKKALENMPLSVELIMEIHGILMKGILGEDEIARLGVPGELRKIECEGCASGTEVGNDFYFICDIALMSTIHNIFDIPYQIGKVMTLYF